MKLRDPEILARREELVKDPALVAELEDHDLLYTDRRMLHSFDEWRARRRRCRCDRANRADEDGDLRLRGRSPSRLGS